MRWIVLNEVLHVNPCLDNTNGITHSSEGSGCGDGRWTQLVVRWKEPRLSVRLPLRYATSNLDEMKSGKHSGGGTLPAADFSSIPGAEVSRLKGEYLKPHANELAKTEGDGKRREKVNELRVGGPEVKADAVHCISEDRNERTLGGEVSPHVRANEAGHQPHAEQDTRGTSRLMRRKLPFPTPSSFFLLSCRVVSCLSLFFVFFLSLCFFLISLSRSLKR
ncbi:hypothetical protein IC006_0447 [Sulfuracidifex tepidarius]|uniref:Transmembrane protein n=1 Tax=Sulfuracidifex tepidarius TaxID=1294262 RepID=A0A510E0B7_9CREN|nr:hypothetical protein IC006_0447 [Sulfuracidifex tepidarius]BBG25912.1 hypothetical protein IC007_0417 [Sulfuracidifex tepidarius]